MRNLALKYIDSYGNWGCVGQQEMTDIMVGFAKLVVEKFTDTQQLKAEIAKEALSLELNYGDTTTVRIIADRLRQLSAV